ncbi:LAMI_0C02718g1_1 [Lachancea mirantina]|uniref:non-specific serine/threonine protein kinase n=1 Tax=Lachancea mirantina TaxID=1230905 RepID=A0A1G4J1M9_9SACH|nr:LAMI_0C02718g1_1 [Lachancea mirantina]
MSSFFLALCCCCSGKRNAYIFFNGQKLWVEKLLGEEGHSFLYLVRSSEGQSFVLKKTKCPFGNLTAVAQAMREINCYKRFQSPHIAQLLDSQVIQESDGSKTVLLLLPYFPRGSLQDAVDGNLLEGTTMAQSDILRIGMGIARGLLCIHGEGEQQSQDEYSMAPTVYGEEHSLLNDHELDTFDSISQRYAHRDLKPSRIMISSEGNPIISDLGACSPAHIEFTSKQSVMQFQDWRADNCTLGFTAPEILDVKQKSVITEKTDTWSFGCLLYMLCFGISPFEREEQVSGASVTYAIATGKYSFPVATNCDSKLLALVQSCLTVDPASRPSMDSVLSQLSELQGHSASS